MMRNLKRWYQGIYNEKTLVKARVDNMSDESAQKSEDKHTKERTNFEMPQC